MAAHTADQSTRSITHANARAFPNNRTDVFSHNFLLKMLMNTVPFYNELHIQRYHLHTMFFALLSLLTGCSGSPTDLLTWREQWEIVVLTEDGGLIEGVASVGNTGMFRGEGQFRARRFFRNGSPILFEMDGGPADVDISRSRDSARIGSALIGRFDEGEHWTLRFSHDQANAIIRIDPGGPNPPLATTMLPSGQWTVASPISHGPTHGWFTAGRRGGMFEGSAIAFHRGGDGRPSDDRRTAVVLGPGVSIGIDIQADQRLQWARIGDEDLPLDTVSVDIATNGSTRIDFRPTVDLNIELRPTGVGARTNGYDHLLAPERWIANASNMKSDRSIDRTRGQFQFGEKIYTVSGFTLQVR